MALFKIFNNIDSGTTALPATYTKGYMYFDAIKGLFYIDTAGEGGSTGTRMAVNAWGALKAENDNYITQDTPYGQSIASTYIKDISFDNDTLTITKGDNTTSTISLNVTDAMVFKGVVNNNNQLPAVHKVGWTYKVGTAGVYAGQICEIGDTIYCITGGSSANNAHWAVIQTNIDGAVVGPATSTAGHIATFTGTTGKAIKDSGFTIETSVPANAVFTDTTYTFNGGTNSFVITPSNGTATTVNITPSIHTLTFGANNEFSFDGSADVNVPVYTGAASWGQG